LFVASRWSWCETIPGSIYDWALKGYVPWRLFKTTNGYHKNDKAFRFAAIPRIHETPITEAILIQIRATLVLCCCLLALCDRWIEQVHIIKNRHRHLTNQNVPIYSVSESDMHVVGQTDSQCGQSVNHQLYLSVSQPRKQTPGREQEPYLAIIEFGFRWIWRILKFEESVIHRGRGSRWITPSEICRILHILRKPPSWIIALLFIQNIFFAQTCKPTCSHFALC